MTSQHPSRRNESRTLGALYDLAGSAQAGARPRLLVRDRNGEVLLIIPPHLDMKCINTYATSWGQGHLVWCTNRKMGNTGHVRILTAFFFCNPILFAICTGTFRNLCKNGYSGMQKNAQ
jgi:hypothetical protein